MKIKMYQFPANYQPSYAGKWVAELMGCSYWRNCEGPESGRYDTQEEAVMDLKEQLKELRDEITVFLEGGG